MSRKNISYSNHHIIPKSRGGKTDSSNLELIKDSMHRAIHVLFANDIFPEQIEKLTDMTSRVLLPEIQKELLEWINSRDIHDPTQWYKEWALLLPRRLRNG